MSRFTVNEKVLYASASQGGHVLTQVTSVLDTGEIELHCKPGYFFPVCEQERKIRKHEQSSPTPVQVKLPHTPTASQQLDVAAAAPITSRSGLTPDAKRPNTGAAETAMTMPGSQPQHVFLTASAIPTGPTVDFSAASAAAFQPPLLPGMTGQVDPSAAFWAQMRGLIDSQTSQLNTTIVGVEQRLGERLDTHEVRISGHDAEIAELRAEMANMKTDIVARRSASVPPNAKQDVSKEAFLGGLPNMKSERLEARAREFVSQADGFVGVETHGNAGTFVIIKFVSSEAMKIFVSENSSRASTVGLRLHRNRGRDDDPNAKARRQAIWDGKHKLIAAGLQENKVVFSRSRFWKEEDSGMLTELGRLEADNRPKWGDHAPSAVKNAAA